MERQPAEILRDALALPADARAALAGSLLDSLDSEVDAGAEQMWASEILRRGKEIDEGTVQLVPWAELRARLERRLDNE